MGATLKRREGSEHEGPEFTGSAIFLEFINTDLLCSVFTRFPLFSEFSCYVVAIEFGNVATGNGNDHSL